MRARPLLGADALQRVLVHVQAALEGDLRLEVLAAVAGLSRAHFQRAFTAAVGESPTAYVSRVRVERAAYLLCVEDRPILDIAYSVGATNPDTFTRAFRRRFGLTPRAFRNQERFGELLSPVRRDHDGYDRSFALSQTRVVRLRARRIAFLRNTGPYETVDPTLWIRLVDWARKRDLTHGTCLGIGHDAPTLTAPEKLRFDAGILVGDDVQASDGVGVQLLPSGTFAVTRHVGAYSTLSEGYPEIFSRAARVVGHRLVGLPCVEFYHDASVDPARAISTTDIHLPIVAVN